MTAEDRVTVTDPPASVITWVQCECGKNHTAAGIGDASVCTCGRKLMPQVWRKGR